MSILDEIVAHKREEIKTLADVANPPHCTRDFAELFQNTPCLIAELKAASPSEGVIAENFDPEDQTAKYVAGDVNAISVLTDEKYFGGSFAVLRNTRVLTDVPLLCKEFIIDEKQIRVARDCGADMVLLIVKILTDEELLRLKTAIDNLGMAALIEIQNEEELERALKVSPDLLLINNRNLTSFDVDMNTTANLLEGIPATIKAIAASGIKSPSDLENFSPRVDGFLIGTTLMRSDDPAEFLRNCRGTWKKHAA
ncbi:MAG: indole-3-glycerol-phosphate synthase [Alphaproteobacteria bacterium]|nr:MAG: indole-3-glycerol-phosphate synthase [Alphaproteobacteria bacterium]